MKTTNNTNPAPATTISPRRARALAIYTAAHAGKLYHQPREVIALPAFTASNHAAAVEAAKLGNLAAYLALRARHQSSGLNLMLDLIREGKADSIREDLPRIAADALTARAAHDEHRALAETYQRIADRITTLPADRETAAQLAKVERDAAARELATAERLERVISTTSHSDRADISQAAALVYWQTADIAAACKAAGKAIAAIAAAKGCTATRTKVKPITAEEAARELDQHPNTSAYDSRTGEYIDTPCRVPFNVQGGNSTTAGYYTIEHRNSRRFPNGWYKVSHYHTTAPYMSYEVFASDEDAPALADNGGINAIYNQQAAEDIAALMSRANLNERERIVCAYMLDNTAAAAGARAVSAHMDKTAERMSAEGLTTAQRQRIQREADKQTEDIRAAAIRDNAMTRAGIYSDSNQRQTLHRIRAKLDKARTAPSPATPAELVELDRRQWEKMQNNRNRYTRTAGEAAAPVVVPVLTYTGADHTAKPTEYAQYQPVWKTSGEPQPITAEDRQRERERERAAQQERERRAADITLIEYRRTLRDHQPTRTAYAAHDAITAAYVFFDHMSRAAQLAHLAPIAAERAATAAQRAAESRAKANAAKGDRTVSAEHTAREDERNAAKLASIAAAIARAVKEDFEK